MSLRIDFALEQARCALDRELAHFLAQTFARTRSLAGRFFPSLCKQALGLRRCGALGLFHHFVRAFACLVEDMHRLIARLADDLFGTCLRFAQVTLALFGGGKSGCDFARALIHRTEDHRPDELHREPDEDDEYEHLHDQREIDVHNCLPTSAIAGLKLSASARR